MIQININDISNKVRSTELDELNVFLSGSIVESDSLIDAFGKIQNQINSGSFWSGSYTPLNIDQTTAQEITGGQPIQDTLTASELVATDANKKLQSLAVVTYPSLTELSYVKGVTSAIQTQLNNAGGGIWTAKTGTFATVATWTFAGTAAQAAMIIDSLFTCTDSAGTTRRIGYISAATEAGGTVTVTVVSDTDLAAGDKDFYIATNRKSKDYEHLVSIPGEVTADATYPQGLWYLNLRYASYLLPVDIAVRTAATGVTASCTTNIYKDTTALFNVAPDLSTNASLAAQRPTTKDLAAGEDISLRIPASAGTTLAADYQARLIIVPQFYFSAL